MVRLNPVISKIIVAVFLIAFFAVFIWAAFFLEPAETDVESATYDGAEGVITVTMKVPLADGSWVASVYVSDSDEGTKYYTTSGIVTPSADRMSFTITDSQGCLLNLPNGSKHVDVHSLAVPPHDTIFFTLEVSDHVYSTEEMIMIGIAVAFMVFAVVLAVIRRIVRGR